jgi:hypothetical protein
MILEKIGLHEGENIYTKPFDHPYFGQLFLASILGLVGYPGVLDPISSNVESVQSIYLMPRIVMGLLAVVDTFLVYKIAERRYDRRVALIAGIFFAVMPFSWLLRRIWLEPIQLPFLLCSVFFALDGLHNKNISEDKKPLLMTLLSGIFLGLAIFTKVPAFTLIPLVGFLILRKSQKNYAGFGLWLIPVVLIPSLWPIHALLNGELSGWAEDFLWQATGRIDRPLWMAFVQVFKIDPMIVVLGIGGLIFAALRRDFLVLLWTVPLLIFLQWIGYVSYWFLIPILPVFCIGSANMILKLTDKIRQKNTRKLLAFTATSCLCIFGLISTIILIGNNVNSSYFQTVAATARLVSMHTTNSNDNNDKSVTLVGNRWVPGFSWILDLIFLEKIEYKKFYTKIYPIYTAKAFVIVDQDYRRFIENKEDNSEHAQAIYNESKTIEEIDDNPPNHDLNRYPFASIRESRSIGTIEIRQAIETLNSTFVSGK